MQTEQVGSANLDRFNAAIGQTLTVTVAVTALAAIGAVAAASLGLMPWLSLEAQFGETALPDFGVWLQVGAALLALILLLYLPSCSRVSKLEGSHRRFHVGMDDVARAYRSAHDSDRAGVFALSGEFDAVRERITHLRQHPDLGGLEPELLELAAQMSLQSRDLAEVYSAEKVKRARAFLEQRQQEVETLSDQISVARRTCSELREWLTDVETEEREVSAEFSLLERDLRDILPLLGYEIEDGPQPNVVPIAKKESKS
ncbi:DNA repair protein [Thioclava sp.]|uniref:DNA repair protein n=1 Tax=Thioclava sp. TaxID=1933450 RepID=UPI003241F0E5